MRNYELHKLDSDKIFTGELDPTKVTNIEFESYSENSNGTIVIDKNQDLTYNKLFISLYASRPTVDKFNVVVDSEFKEFIRQEVEIEIDNLRDQIALLTAELNRYISLYNSDESKIQDLNNQIETLKRLLNQRVSVINKIPDTITVDKYLFSDRTGIQGAPGFPEIGNTLLSKNRTAKAIIQDDGNFVIYTGKFDSVGNNINFENVLGSNDLKVLKLKATSDAKTIRLELTSNTLQSLISGLERKIQELQDFGRTDLLFLNVSNSEKYRIVSIDLNNSPDIIVTLDSALSDQSINSNYWISVENVFSAVYAVGFDGSFKGNSIVGSSKRQTAGPAYAIAYASSSPTANDGRLEVGRLNFQIFNIGQIVDFTLIGAKEISIVGEDRPEVGTISRDANWIEIVGDSSWSGKYIIDKNRPGYLYGIWTDNPGIKDAGVFIETPKPIYSNLGLAGKSNTYTTYTFKSDVYMSIHSDTRLNAAYQTGNLDEINAAKQAILLGPSQNALAYLRPNFKTSGLKLSKSSRMTLDDFGVLTIYDKNTAIWSTYGA